MPLGHYGPLAGNDVPTRIHSTLAPVVAVVLPQEGILFKGMTRKLE